MTWRLATVLTLSALAGLGVGQAQATEPQILGLVASNGAMPLVCGEEICAVELSAFCMQERAPVPPVGTPYGLTADGAASITLEATRADGGRVRLPVAELARFVSARSNRSVRLEIPVAALSDVGLSRPAVTIDSRAVVVPRALLASDDPAAVAEIALVTGPLREVAERIVDRAGAGTAAAQITNRLINAVPDDLYGDVENRTALWHETVRNGDPALQHDAEGLEMAREAFDRCAGLPGGGFITFRQCLAARHDIFLSPQNRAYWEAVQTGS